MSKPHLEKGTEPMFTGDEDVEATALRAQGWSISAIARHLDRDRKTVRGYLNGERVPGRRRRVEPDPFDRFVPYLRQRLTDDPHVWASALFDEVQLLASSCLIRASRAVCAPDNCVRTARRARA